MITQEQKVKIWEDWQQLKSTRLVGQLHGISRTTVSKYLQEFPAYKRELQNPELIEKIKEAAKRARSMNHLANQLGLNYAVVKRICDQNDIVITRTLINTPLEGQIFGRWKVLSDLGYLQPDGSYNPNERIGGFFVRALCTGCDNTYIIDRNNLIQRYSNQCKVCRYKHRTHRKKVS